MDWDDLRFFLAVARRGSIRGAAAALAVNHSTVSRRINGFELGLGERLFDRHASGYRLTSVGEELLAAAERIEQEVTGLERRSFGRNRELSGLLRVTIPAPFASHLMAPIFARFMAEYPGIELEIEISRKTFDLSRREADVALRIAKVSPPQHLFGRRLVRYGKSVYASVEYLRRHRQPESMNWIGWGDNTPTPWWVRETDFAQLPLRHNVNHEGLQLELAKAGAGITMLPCFMGDVEPGLRRVAPGRVLPSHDIWVLTHSDLRDTARARVFMGFVADAVQQKVGLLRGECPWQEAS